MKISLKSGAGELLFGMKEKDVKALYGEPDRNFKDEDKNVIYLYNDKKLRLTFYQDEDFRLGYIITSNPQAELFGKKVIGEKWENLTAHLSENKLKAFEKDVFDGMDNQFNEDNWVIFQVEFGEVMRVEIGAIINAKDEFDWKF
jgi:mRNA-degrading endonuclease HigB of HigAB toxin-antitoxin module